jgi:glycogen synthase
MKILVINYEYPPVGGGGGDVSQILAQGYVSRGHEVHVLTSHWGNLQKIEKVNEHLTINRIFAFRKAADNCTPLRMAAFCLCGIPAALRLSNSFKPDVVHCHFAVPVAPIGYILKLFKKIPFFVTFHGGDVPGHQPEQTEKYFRIIRGSMRFILKRATKCVSVSKHLANSAKIGYGINNLTVIPNGVDTDIFKPDSNIKKDSTVRCVFVGRFSREKRPQDPIEAASILLNRGIKNFKLIVLGSGPLEKEVIKKTEDLNICDYVEFKGWVGRETVTRILRESDIFILPSEIEGMPVACLQAMSSGLAVVASSNKGALEVVKDGVNGIFADIGDCEGIANALECLITDENLRKKMGEKSREVACSSFSWDSVIDKYLDLFKN